MSAIVGKSREPTIVRSRIPLQPLLPKNKSKRGRPRSKSAPAVLNTQKEKGKKRKQWTNEEMENAIHDVTDRSMPVLRAAKKHGVPKSTLHDRISGKVSHGEKPGPKPLLTAAEESEFADFLVEVSQAGYGKTRREVRQIAGRVAVDKGKKDKAMVSHGWFRRFLLRQPHLSYRKGDPTANVRMNCLTKEVITDYFNLLKDVLTENNLFESPNQIYNVDETGIALDGHAPRVIAKRGQKKVRYRTSGNRSQLTVIACVNASGQCIPPFVIFDAKRLNMEWRKGEVVGTAYGLSSNGWVDSELFRGWLSEHFLTHAVGARPLLLLLDGHSSHYQPQLIEYAREFGVIMFCLPPHTTHESQPLDASVFKSLKQNWQHVCHDFIQSNPSVTITKYQFSGLLNQAWGSTMNPTTICSGFRRCGVYPFNPDAIDCSVSIVNPGASLQQGRAFSEAENRDENSGRENQPTSVSLSSDKLVLFQRRLAEGYNIPNEEYMEWLKESNPEMYAEIYGGEIPLMSIVDAFSSVPVASPVMMADSELMANIDEVENGMQNDSTVSDGTGSSACGDESALTSNVDQITNSPNFDDNEVQSAVSGTDESAMTSNVDQRISSQNCDHNGTVSNNVDSELTSNVDQRISSQNCDHNGTVSNNVDSELTSNMDQRTNAESCDDSDVQGTTCSSNLTTTTSCNRSKENLRYISKYLVQYVPDARPQNKAAAVRISGARVLTSDKCVAILKEREEKQKQQQQEKERKRLEREQKKREKEEEQRKKKALAAEKKALAEQKKALVAAKKAEKEARKGTVTSNSVRDSSNRKRQRSDGHQPATRSRRLTEAAAGSRSTTMASNDGQNECCVCFELYRGDDETDDWLQCACKRWLHEDCITDVVHDKFGRELLCPYCSL